MKSGMRPCRACALGVEGSLPPLQGSFRRRVVLLQELDGFMLASGPFYISGTFWAGAGVAVAIVSVVIPVILWLLGSPRRLLTYSLVSPTALLTHGARRQGGGGLNRRVTRDEHLLNAPYVVSLRVESRSRRDIRRADFEEDQPFLLELNAPILKL